jgi:putative addiction module CopG family antidote
MEVVLSPEFERFVKEQVETGQFASPSEVFEAGLTSLMFDNETEEDPEEIAALEASERQIAAGETVPLKDLIAEFRRDGLIE